MDAINPTTEATMTETTTIHGTYDVHETQRGWLLGKLEKMNRKAVKLGLAPIELKWVGEKNVPVLGRDDKPTGEVNRYLVLEVTGTAPVVKGWTFVGTLQHAGEVGTIIRTIPGFDGKIPAAYRTAAPVCDHCKVHRARKDTYLLVNEAGEFKQVGSNCLADFLGGLDPHAAATWARFAETLDETCKAAEGMSAGGAYRFGIEVFYGHIAAAIRVAGRWTSRSAARAYDEASGGVGGIQATVDIAMSRLTARGPKEREATAALEPTREDMEFGEQALQWVRDTFHAKDSDARSDFEHNLVVATSQAAITHREAGIAAAGVGMYWRHLNNEAERKAREEAGKNSEHFGEVGQRLVFFAKTVGTPRFFDNDFGGKWLYKLITREGNLVTWWATHKLEELEAGEEIALLGTVKKHDEFRGEKQTVVNRVTIPTEKQIDKATGADKKKKAQAKAARAVEVKFDQLTDSDW